jgi:hypothetical protein
LDGWMCTRVKTLVQLMVLKLNNTTSVSVHHKVLFLSRVYSLRSLSSVRWTSPSISTCVCAYTTKGKINIASHSKIESGNKIQQIFLATSSMSKQLGMGIFIKVTGTQGSKKGHMHDYIHWINIKLFIYLHIHIYIVVLGGGTLLYLQKVLQCIKHTILEFTPPLLSFFLPFPPFLE